MQSKNSSHAKCVTGNFSRVIGLSLCKLIGFQQRIKAKGGVLGKFLVLELALLFPSIQLEFH